MNLPTLFKQGTLGLALLASSFAASAALQTFTLDPAAVGLAGSAFTADNLLISDYSRVTNGPGNTFTEEGYLSITGAQLAGQNLSIAGLNSNYGLFIHFTGTGSNDGNNPLTQVSIGSFGTLNFDLYGYNGTASFGFSGSTPTNTVASPTLLASGSLISGTVVSVPSGGLFSPNANADVSFNTVATAFFSQPNAFYGKALTSFTNTSSQVQLFNDGSGSGFLIQSGGGTINFVGVVPEPASYALLLAGLGVVGSIARRRARTAA